MTKEEARKNLEDYLKSHDVKLPIVDSIVMRYTTPFVISDITFKGLLCIAYDLRPQEKDEL
jgi:hypothetical protein